MPTGTLTSTEPNSGSPFRARASSGSRLFTASARRNATGGGWQRRRRWQPARDALWAFLDEHVAKGARVAIVGAGNGDDLPLRRLARRAGQLDLIDLDPAALRRARLRVPFARNIDSIVDDVTGGAADALVRRAVGEPVAVPDVPTTPVGHDRYDVVVADLIATQLLYPALIDSRLPAPMIDKLLLRDGQRLTDSVVARLHAAAPDGIVVHVHDILGWWNGHPQPFSIEAALALGADDPAAALTLCERGQTPYGCDPRRASRSLDAQLEHTAFWRWPFAPGTNYLVCATVARSSRSPGRPAAGSQGS